MELVPGTVIAGRYRLERLLASGGMGAVWVARHTSLNSEIAIKFMHGDPTELTVARSRFEREARTASLIRHPNVVTVQDYGIEGQMPYMAMELLHGENLDEYLQRKKRLTLVELEPIISQVSRGLRKAHETGIVHRDLKPSNVFISREDDGREIVKILDFGIAKEIDTTLGQHTKTTELMGSPHYMSPEQLRSTKKSDFRSDLWSLGVIIYKALTGVTPFPGDTLAEVMVQVFSGKWTPPSTVVPGLSPTLDAFFQRVFARKPDDRFQSIHEMHNAFVAVVAGKPLPPAVAASPAPNPTTTPLPLGSSSSSWPAVVPAPRPSAPSYMPTDTPAVGLSPYETPKTPATFPDPPTAPTFAPPIPPAPTSNPGLSGPPDVPMGVTAPAGFGITNTAPNWLDQRGLDRTLPDEPRIDPIPEAPTDPGQTIARPDIPNFSAPPTAADPARRRNLAIMFGTALVVLIIGVVIAAAGSGGPSDKLSTTETSGGTQAVKVPTAEPSNEGQPVAAASGAAVTPDEIASAVPDESPVEVVSNEPPTPTPSATQTSKSNWKPIGKGQARLLIKSTGGVCKITINSTYYGVTPLDVIVEAGKTRVFCRMPTGSTRSKELRVPENRITKIEFEVKQ